MPIVTAQSDALFRTLIQTAVDGIIVIDGEGIIHIYNMACERLFGFHSDEVVGRNVKMLMPEPYRAEHDGYIEHYRATGIKRIIGIGRNVSGQRKDGTTFPMYLSVGEGYLNDRAIFVGIIHDLTERESAARRNQELQDELLHVSRLSAMGQMSAALAHELNQPLTAILNYLTAARRTLATTDDPQTTRALGFVDKAAQQTTRAGQIIRQLREFVEKRETVRNEQNLNGLVEETIALAFVGSADSGVKVYKQLDATVPPVLMDKIQMGQVLLNLIRNSIEAMQSVTQRELTIKTARMDPNLVELVVSDTGPGLPAEILSRLFQPFVTTKEKGMGIGLSICQTIVEAHGGRIWTSASEDRGAKFHVTLPAIPAN
ncbi:MAG TPA: PAS domain S-box protein [Micropepsaceae bacterium]|nr:PAS domain S-box protein [Micropepsaceae bacterium]